MKMMREEVLRKLFCKKISDELELFHLRKLRMRQEEIYRSSYEIESKINIYEALMELSEKMDVNSLSCMLDIPDVLEHFYKRWVRTEDTLWEQMKANINRNIHDATEIYIRRERMRKGYEKVNIDKRTRKKRAAS